MDTLHDVGQKVKGKMQKAKGEIEMNTGRNLHGAWEKTKGSINEIAADAKLKARANRYD